MNYLLSVIFLLQVDNIGDVISELTRQGPLISLFLLIIIGMWLLMAKKDKSIKEKEEEIKTITKKNNDELKELNEYIRENDKENMKILSDVSNTLDKVMSNQIHSDNIMIQEINNLRDTILMKLDNLDSKNR